MAEYYPLLAKAVGSLPNSTLETRRVVYERARKALIGQLRTLHPPVPDEDIERESVELDRAIARIEEELAAPAGGEAAASPPPAASPTAAPSPAGPPMAAPTKPTSPLAPRPPPPAVRPIARTGGAIGPGTGKPFTPLRTKVPAARPADPDPKNIDVIPPSADDTAPPAIDAAAPLLEDKDRSPAQDGRVRLDGQRPIAPQPPAAKGPKRQMWIIWVGIGVVVALVAGAALKLRDHPESIARTKPAESQAQGDSGKISERVGGTQSPDNAPPTAPAPSEAKPDAPTAQAPATPTQEQPAQEQPAPTDQAATPANPAAPVPPTANNPEVPVAQRAALLVEAPDEPNKVKTFLGNVVWKLNNVSEGPSDAVGLGVEADIDLPDDKMKATVTFEKNTDSSLPASHTIKVRFVSLPGSATGDVKQISVPALRNEDSPQGNPLAGVTVPVIQNSFLVGLSPGNAETANMDLLRNLQWIDIPMLLTNGKIAKLTFEKGASGQRDLNDAIAAWSKQ